MEYHHGTFGILDMDEMEERPLILYDGGIEERMDEAYDFQNENRKGYGGYLFQYTLAGKGIFEKEGVPHPVERGTAFLVAFPEESRYYLPKGRDGKWEFCYLHFDGMAAKPFVDKIRDGYGSLLAINPGSIPVCMILTLHEKMMSGGGLKKYEGGEFLYGFLGALLRELEQPAGTDRGPLVRRACEIMEQEYGTLEGLEALAGRLDVSSAHFSRVFKAKTGIAPIQYLTHIRVQNAMNDLLNTEDRLTVISERNGFSGENYFCKVFRRMAGMTPMEYRRRGGPV